MYRDATAQPIVTDYAAGISPFLFNTKYYDHEVGVYDYGLRFYHPRHGQWVSRDPVGQSGGLNLYAFCNNDPVNRYDAFGATSESVSYSYDDPRPVELFDGRVVAVYKYTVTTTKKNSRGSTTSKTHRSSYKTRLFENQYYYNRDAQRYVDGNLRAQLKTMASVRRLKALEAGLEFGLHMLPGGAAADYASQGRWEEALIHGGIDLALSVGTLGVGHLARAGVRGTMYAVRASAKVGVRAAARGGTRIAGRSLASSTRGIRAAGRSIQNFSMQHSMPRVRVSGFGMFMGEVRFSSRWGVKRIRAEIFKNADISTKLAVRAAARGRIRGDARSIGTRAHRYFEKMNQRLDHKLQSQGGRFRLSTEQFRDVHGGIAGRRARGSIGADTFLEDMNSSFKAIFDMKTHGGVARPISRRRQNQFMDRFGTEAEEIFIQR